MSKNAIAGATAGKEKKKSIMYIHIKRTGPICLGAENDCVGSKRGYGLTKKGRPREVRGVVCIGEATDTAYHTPWGVQEKGLVKLKTGVG